MFLFPMSRLTVLCLVITKLSILNKHILMEKDLNSDLSLKNIIKNKEITADILPSADVYFDVQKQEIGRAGHLVEGQFKKKNL